MIFALRSFLVADREPQAFDLYHTRVKPRSSASSRGFLCRWLAHRVHMPSCCELHLLFMHIAYSRKSPAVRTHAITCPWMEEPSVRRKTNGDLMSAAHTKSRRRSIGSAQTPSTAVNQTLRADDELLHDPVVFGRIISITSVDT